MLTGSWSARLVPLALILLVGLTWAGVAQAQEAFEDQYGSQVASGEAAIESVADPGTGGADPGTGGADPGTGGADPGTGGEMMGLLPFTGGPLLPFAALGILALGSVGVLALRRSRDQQQDT
jgi:hypothetical protein